MRCTLCIENINEKRNSMSLHCGHEFHANCFISWLSWYNSKNVKNLNIPIKSIDTCPCCRTLAIYKPKRKLTKHNIMMLVSRRDISSIGKKQYLSKVKQIYNAPWLYIEFINDVNINRLYDSKIKKLFPEPNIYYDAELRLNKQSMKRVWDSISYECQRRQIYFWMNVILNTFVASTQIDILNDASELELDESDDNEVNLQKLGQVINEIGITYPYDNDNWNLINNLTDNIEYISEDEIEDIDDIDDIGGLVTKMKNMKIDDLEEGEIRRHKIYDVVHIVE